jgi:tetratricopeptide (TPR) repeat protein
MLIEGALLHLDISLLLPIRAMSPIFDKERGVVESSDGSTVGSGSPATHLEFGRALLDMLPSPSHHEGAAQWYHAAAAHLGAKYDHANGLVHLARARRLFPRDPFVLFASGCLHEVLAAPQVQAVIATTRLSHRESFDVESAGSNLRQAERFFAQALENDARFHEARVRLARVMSLQGRQDEALAELQKLPADLGDPVVAYFARLFAGRAEELLDRQVAARRSFERAAALFPGAQSPHLALSRLAIVRDERAAASRVLSVLAAPVEDAVRSDPWWTYHTGPGRAADALVADFRRHVASERLR